MPRIRSWLDADQDRCWAKRLRSRLEIYQMKTKKFLSRRELVAALAVPPMAPLATIEPNTSASDAQLIALGRQFDNVTAQVDNAIDEKLDIADDVLDQLGRIEAKITATPALTIDGLRVKARAACWALLGDLDDGDPSTMDKRIALSIVRDLIRVYDPSLERSGALKNLVADLD
jgi:hypothetical protein